MARDRQMPIFARRISWQFLPAKDSVKFLFFVLLIILIVQIGFWKRLGAVLGALVMLIPATSPPAW
jgi:hypothetical protein